ncbi:hypothetical protein GGI03_007119 [Coemansia sp. RSA 2337]|nr:hypothetical protein GGI03_007119 [Coemansia sp. RSA 2337]
MSQDNNIKVIARFRPPNSLEVKSGGTSVVEIEDDTTRRIFAPFVSRTLPSLSHTCTVCKDASQLKICAEFMALTEHHAL